MTYRIVKNPKAWWPVNVPGVTDDGKAVTNSFEMRFLLLDEDANDALMKDIEAEFEEANRAAVSMAMQSRMTTAFVMRVAEDWRGVEQVDDDGAVTSIPFSAENVALLSKLPNVSDAILSAYRACRAGQPETRRGN